MSVGIESVKNSGFDPFESVRCVMVPAGMLLVVNFKEKRPYFANAIMSGPDRFQIKVYPDEPDNPGFVARDEVSITLNEEAYKWISKNRPIRYESLEGHAWEILFVPRINLFPIKGL